jgi:lipid-binding SYLF domain-containing protein
MVAFAGLCVVGCSHAPIKPGERADLKRDAQATLARLQEKDPSLRPLIDRSAGYLVFPEVGQGGFIVGGASGNGVLFQNGQVVGFAQMKQVSAGALAGGERYSEVIVVRDPQVIDDMRSGRFNFGAQASATMVRSGAAASATFDRGVAVFTDPKSGAMVNASLNTQKISVTM